MLQIGGGSPGQGQVEGQRPGVETSGCREHHGIVVSGSGVLEAVGETMTRTAMSGPMPVRVRGPCLWGNHRMVGQSQIRLCLRVCHLIEGLCILVLVPEPIATRIHPWGRDTMPLSVLQHHEVQHLIVRLGLLTHKLGRTFHWGHMEGRREVL